MLWQCENVTSVEKVEKRLKNQKKKKWKRWQPDPTAADIESNPTIETLPPSIKYVVSKHFICLQAKKRSYSNKPVLPMGYLKVQVMTAVSSQMPPHRTPPPCRRWTSLLYFAANCSLSPLVCASQDPINNSIPSDSASSTIVMHQRCHRWICDP